MGYMAVQLSLVASSAVFTAYIKSIHVEIFCFTHTHNAKLTYKYVVKYTCHPRTVKAAILSVDVFRLSTKAIAMSQIPVYAC